MRPSDIDHLVTVSDPAVSPDGRQIAYVLTRPDPSTQRYRSAVWLVPSDGSAPPRQLSSGADDDTQPRWSPDGARLALTSTRQVSDPHRGEVELHSLHVLPVLVAGERVRLVERDEPITGLTWSPDGARLAFTSRVRGDRYAPATEAARPPRRVDRLFPRLDSVGWTVDRPTQVFVIDAAGAGPARQLTSEQAEHEAPAWSPDGSTLAFIAALHPDADLDVVNDIYLIAADDPQPEPHRLTRSGDGTYANPAFSPDGSQVAVLASRGRIGYRHARLATVDVATGAETVRSADLDLTCAPYPAARPPLWDGEDLLTLVEDRGSVPVRRVRPDGSSTVEMGAHRWVTHVDLAGGVLAAVISDPVNPGELYALRDGEQRCLTSHQRDFLAKAPALPAERFAVASEDGTEIDAWLIRPAGFDPARRYPMLLNIHGGPHTQYGDHWFDEFQMYAGAGYAVLFANPHGSTGRSEDFARAIISPHSGEDPGTGWGGIDYRDCMAVLDEALRRFDFVDPARLGVMGGSYGGYLTSWIIGHTDRFAAAVSERAVNNLLSLEWSSDAAGYFRFETGVSHLDDPQEYLRMSPITYVRDIRTPVLILHSEDDLRCPVEQADCLWVALRLLGRPVAYHRFSGESHELSRSGSPAHRIQRAELILEWFARHLGGPEPGSADATAPASAGSTAPAPAGSTAPA